MSHKTYREEKDCLNCGAVVDRKFCPECGQENLQTRENFFHLTFHFISDYFHFDSKFFRSLVPLFVKPGFLTREYWSGKRVRYIHPLRLFFFITIIFMISTTYFYNRFGGEMKRRMIIQEPWLAQVDSSALATMNDSVKIYIPALNDSLTVAAIKGSQEKEVRQTKKFSAGIDNVFVNLKYVTFFLLPLYALFFKLFYRKQRPYYVDHLVYTMHLQSFVYCLFAVMFLLPFVLPLSLIAMRQAGILLIFIYIFISLNFIYRQAWWKTVLKSLALTFSLNFVTALAIVGIAFFDAVFLQ
jgi:hypothetical protein